MKTSCLTVSSILIACGLFAGSGAARATPEIPKVWDEAALADWATPVAGLKLRPTNMSADEYYSMHVENLRTYPVYFPGREPDGYLGDAAACGAEALNRARKAHD